MDFKALPKIELHAHLSGSISRQCLHEIWVLKKERGETELEDPLIEMPEGKHDYDLDTSENRVTGPYESFPKPKLTTTPSSSFFPLFSRYIYGLCNDRASLVYTTNSVLSDFAADGVVYLELRTTPRAIASEGMRKDDYVQTVLDCISTSNKSSTLKTNLILSIDRRNDLPTAMQVVELATKYRNQGVVGIDLCGDPAAGDVSLFRPAFEEAKKRGIKITIHFAEAPNTTTPNELTNLLEYQPDRIGHVINVPDDVKQEIVRRKLGLELCLSCNVHAKMITGTYSDHHFGWWRETGCPIALSTDDVGVFGSTLSNEYRLIAEHFDLNRKEICDLARGAVEVIFGVEEEKERLRSMMWRE
ncbi:probable adenosine deaminase [Phialocephala subalpina]|uniref:Probable adenosine deaminase n=1 Tax=Phialocephala subalpina TaxID=576137 RepID=A0A1L7WX36_9HELO|nr:probable adenosine deaminase [Phialocephala subalpina]